MQQQIRTRAAIRLLATTKQSPTGPSSTTSYEDQTGEELLADSTEKVIAPSESYKKKDEHQLEHQQQHRQTEENKEATSPIHKMSDTAVRNNDHLKTTYSAVTPSGLDEENEVLAFRGGGGGGRTFFKNRLRSMSPRERLEFLKKRRERANQPRELKEPESENLSPELQHAVEALKFFNKDTNQLAKILTSWYSGHYMGDDWNTRGEMNLIGPMAKKAVRDNFIRAMAYVGRHFPTKLGKVAYRVTNMVNGRPVLNKMQNLDLGPRSILSFSQSPKAVEKFANGIGYKNNSLHKATRMVVRVPLTSNNYIATTSSVWAFVKLVHENAEKLGVYANWWKSAWDVVRKFAGQDEVLMYFKDPHKVPAVITTLIPLNKKVTVNAICGAVTPSGLDEEDLPPTSQQYASDIDDATRRPESTKNQTLYDTTASLKRLIVSARGGIFDTHGDPEMDLDHSQGEPKPNSQVLPYNGSVIEADRLGTESDPLTKDQENYGTSGRPALATVPMLLDPETSSTYSRENNVNRNTTEKEIPELDVARSHDTGSTVDEPEPASTLDMRGQEGLTTFCSLKKLAAAMRATPEPHDMATPATSRPSKGYTKPSLKKSKRHLGAKSLYDGDFDPAGRTTGDHMITEDPDNHGYYNLHSSIDEDDALEVLCTENVEADADPKLFNMAAPPLPSMG